MPWKFIAVPGTSVDVIVGGWFSSVALTMKEVTRDKILNIMTSTQHPNTTTITIEGSLGACEDQEKAGNAACATTQAQCETACGK